MKRFLLFEGYSYYPSGGWGDFVDSFDTLEAAKAARRPELDWFHVVDTVTGEIVEHTR